MKKRVGLQRILIALSVAVLVYGAKFFVFNREIELLDEIVDIVALVIVMLGFCVRIASRGCKEDCSAKGEKLVITGLYAYIRNPMYLGTLFIGTGVAVAIFHPLAIGIFWLGYAAIYIPQILREEKLLLSLFGTDYKEYCERIPRLIPRLSSLRDFLSELFPRNGKWIWRESLSIIGVLLCMLVVEMVVDVKVFGMQEVWKEPLEFIGALFIFSGVLYLLSKERK